jgi:hypothetical protein
MSNYKCEQCDYTTIRKSNLIRHINTHNKQVKVNQQQKLSRSPLETISKLSSENEFKCTFCNNSYPNSGNLARHKISCLEKRKLVDELNEKNEFLKQKDEIIKQKNETLIQKDETISILKSEVSHLKMIVNNSGSIIKTSVSTMAYVLKNYRDAPVLESIKDYSAIHYEQNNTEFVENLIFEHNNSKLYAHIGDFIIKTYKKDDPTQQSIWNSDTSRLTYLIREIIANNKVDWKVDKKGIKTTKFIIDPILEYIDTQIRNYVQGYKVNHRTTAKEAERIMFKLKSANEILKDIENKVLSEDILKYIAAHFYLTKSDELMET